jgi:hypothetical protein
MLFWHCDACHNNSLALMSFTEIIAGLPDPPVKPEDFGQKDVDFLKKAHIMIQKGGEKKI